MIIISTPSLITDKISLGASLTDSKQCTEVNTAHIFIWHCAQVRDESPA